MSDAVFNEIAENIKADASLVKSIGGVYQFNVNSGGQVKNYTVDVKNAPGSVKNGPAPKADCTIVIKEEDLLDMKAGKLNGQQAFMQGKIKIQGNMSYAMKLNQIFKKKIEAPKPAAAAAAPAPASAAPASAPAGGDDKIAGIFATLASAIVYPAQVVRSEMLHKHKMLQTGGLKTWFSCCGAILRTSGTRGLFHGYSNSLISSCAFATE